MICTRARKHGFVHDDCSINLKAVSAFLSLLVLHGCADLDLGGYAGQGMLLDSDTTLTLVQEIGSGVTLRMRGSDFGIAAARTYALGYAAAVAARGNYVYVVDQFSAELVQINLALGEARVLTTLPDPTTHGVYVTQDLIVYVVDKSARAVRQLNDAGQTTRLFTNPALIPAPVDVAETDWGDAIVVADALHNQLVMFNTLVGAFEVIGANASRLSLAQVVQAIAATRNSVYILDPQLGEVIRFDLHGNPIGSYGEDELQMPTALAVDRCGRLFVADQSGQGILVSLSDMMRPAARAQHNAIILDQITDLWVDEGFLYVAAGAQGIKIFRIEPSCPAL